jgi:hypothetical protein
MIKVLKYLLAVTVCYAAIILLIFKLMINNITVSKSAPYAKGSSAGEKKWEGVVY